MAITKKFNWDIKISASIGFKPINLTLDFNLRPKEKNEIMSPLIKSEKAPMLPEVILLSDSVSQKLIIINKEKNHFYLHGSKFSNTLKNIIEVPIILPTEPHHYYLLTDKLEEDARRVIGINGEKTEPFEIYLSDGLNNKYVAKFFLLIRIKNGEVTIHTQQLGVKKEDW